MQHELDRLVDAVEAAILAAMIRPVDWVEVTAAENYGIQEVLPQLTARRGSQEYFPEASRRRMSTTLSGIF